MNTLILKIKGAQRESQKMMINDIAAGDAGESKIKETVNVS